MKSQSLAPRVHFLFLTVQSHPFPSDHHLVTSQHGRYSSDHAKEDQARACGLPSSTDTKEGAIQRRYESPRPVSLLGNARLIVCRHPVSSPRCRGRGCLRHCLFSDPSTDWSKGRNKEDHALRPLNVLPADATRTQTPQILKRGGCQREREHVLTVCLSPAKVPPPTTSLFTSWECE